MTRIIQISAAAVLAAFASTAFVSTAQASHTLRVCNVTSINAGDEIRRDCGGKEIKYQKRKQRIQQVTPGAAAGPVRRIQNFKSGNFYYEGDFKEGSGGNGNGGNGSGGNGSGGGSTGGGATGGSP